MNNLDSRSPAWLSDDEPLPIEVRDALRLADQEDGQADQIARLEARLAPLFLSPSSAASESATSTAQTTGRTLWSAGSMLSAGAALLGLAALVWPPRELARQNRGSLAASYPRDADSELPPRPLKALEFAPPSQQVASFEALTLAAELPLTKPALAEPAANGLAASTPAAITPAAMAQVTRALPVGRAASPAARPAEREHAEGANALALEARLLSRARQALEQAPSDALRLTERHRAHFPNGVLVEEREAIAIRAMRKAGLEEAAAARFKQFLARFPESPHARKLDAAARPSHVNR